MLPFLQVHLPLPAFLQGFQRSFFKRPRSTLTSPDPQGSGCCQLLLQPQVVFNHCPYGPPLPAHRWAGPGTGGHRPSANRARVQGSCLYSAVSRTQIDVVLSLIPLGRTCRLPSSRHFYDSTLQRCSRTPFCPSRKYRWGFIVPPPGRNRAWPQSMLLCIPRLLAQGQAGWTETLFSPSLWSFGLVLTLSQNPRETAESSRCHDMCRRSISSHSPLFDCILPQNKQKWNFWGPVSSLLWRSQKEQIFHHDFSF